MTRERRRGRTALLVGASLVPLGLVGGLVVLAGQGPGSESGPERRDAPSTSSPERQATRDDGGRPLAGRTVVIDPGHNPTNHRHPGKMSRKVDIGTGRKSCDTAGTATDSGYAEAEFTLDVARSLRDELREKGAKVRLTQNGDRPWGPCIDERAAIGNRADADAVVSLHADGAASGVRGFHVIAPERVKRGKADTTAVTRPSRRLAEAVVTAYGEATGMRPASYAGGGDGLVTREDLGGLNLSRVPKVFLECGNMRDARDAALLTDPAWRERAAHGVAEGLLAFLTGEDGGTPAKHDRGVEKNAS